MSDLSMTDAEQAKLEEDIRTETEPEKPVAKATTALAKQQRLLDLYPYGDYSNKKGGSRRKRSRRRRTKKSRGTKKFRGRRTKR
jgi:hypothetical protein